MVIEGHADHAGPSPMHLRRDALAAAAKVVSAVEEIARDAGAVGTVGRIAAEPNVINPVPGRVVLSVDFRHRGPEALEALVDELRERIVDLVAERGV